MTNTEALPEPLGRTLFWRLGAPTEPDVDVVRLEVVRSPGGTSGVIATADGSPVELTAETAGELALELFALRGTIVGENTPVQRAVGSTPSCPSWCAEHTTAGEEDHMIEFHGRVLFAEKSQMHDGCDYLTLGISQFSAGEHGLYPAQCWIQTGVDNAIATVIPSSRLRDLAAQLLAAAKVIEAAGGTPHAEMTGLRIVPPAPTGE